MKIINNSYIIVPTGGLCNRLRVIFSWLQYSIEQQKHLMIIWQQCEECPGIFLDYFKCPSNCTFIENQETYTYKGCLIHPLIKIDKNTYKDLILKDEIDLLLTNTINEYGKYNSVHIRRTDLNPLLKRANQHYTSDDLFYDFIHKSDKMVYLATDNADTQIKYYNLFPQKILIRSFIQPKDKLRQTPIKDAILDAFICINSDKFLGTHYSSFSNFIRCMMV